MKQEKSDFPLMSLKIDVHTQRGEIPLPANPQIFIQKRVDQEQQLNASTMKHASISKQLSPVLPFRRIGLPSRSPLMGTTVILYSVPGCRPGNKQPVPMGGQTPAPPPHRLSLVEGRGGVQLPSQRLEAPAGKEPRMGGIEGSTEEADGSGGGHRTNKVKSTELPFLVGPSSTYLPILFINPNVFLLRTMIFP